MKKLSFLLALIMLLSLLFVACGSVPSNSDTDTSTRTSSRQDKDDDDDDRDDEDDDDNNGGATSNVITIQGFTEKSKGLYCSAVSSDITQIDLSSLVTVPNGTTWKLYRDYEGENEYTLKSITLTEGKNTAYLVVFSSSGNPVIRCELEIYCGSVHLAFNLNGGTMDESAITIYEIGDTIESLPTPTKTYSDFLGWYLNGSQVEAPFTIEENITLEALWQFNPPVNPDSSSDSNRGDSDYGSNDSSCGGGNDTVAITFKLGGGTMEEDSYVEYTSGDMVKSLPTPTKTGVEFLGWYIGDEFTEAPFKITEDMTLTAKWSGGDDTSSDSNTNTPAGPTVTITLDPDGGSLPDDADAEFEAIIGDRIGDLPTPTRPGYTFLGWFEDGNAKWEIDKKSEVEGYDMTIVALWEANGNYDTDTETDIETEETIYTKWNGKTLDVLATLWYGTVSPEYAGAWSQPEFYVNGYSNQIQYGQTINDAVWARQEFIQDTYGVTLKWHATRSAGVMQNELQSGLKAGYDKYHIALPRMFEAQNLISADTVYDLANSEYIDLSASYYNQASVESFSVYGHTFFVAGDFSFVDDETAYVIFYNQAISESLPTFPNLYTKVKNGSWTISELAKWAKLIGKDDNGETGYQDTDTYGFGSTSLASFFQSSGIQQVSTRTVSGQNYKQYYVSLNENAQAITDLVTEISSIKSSTWARTSWDGGNTALTESFTNGDLLFYHEAVQKLWQFPKQNGNLKVGVLPMPKLYEDQESYYAPLAPQTTLMCIPKATTDREMSEFFFEMFAKTGQEYVMEAYYETLEQMLYDDGETSRADALEMLTNYVFPGMCYDQGYMYDAMGQTFMTEVQSQTVYSPSTSTFLTAYAEKYPNAQKLLDDTYGWNTKAMNYKE